MSDKTMFPCAYPEYQKKRINTTFWQDFTIADKCGLIAVKDTYKRAFAGWKDNIKYLVELASVLNHKCWQWNELDDPQGLCQFYTDKYYEIVEYANNEEERHFKDDEILFFNMVLD